MNKKNKYLYKYKTVKTIKDLERVIEIIETGHIYLPRYDQLNDPYESYMNIIHTGEAGSSILHHSGKRRDYINEKFKQFGILSLTSNCRNPVMWTMYTNYYEGICIGFENLKEAKKIKYRKKDEKPKNIYFNSLDMDEQELIDTLMVKYDLWEYEDEYRIISKEKYLNIEENIKLVILGQNLNTKIKKLIYNECIENNIVVYETFINPNYNKIIIKKYGYDIQYDGSKVEDDLK